MKTLIATFAATLIFATSMIAAPIVSEGDATGKGMQHITLDNAGSAGVVESGIFLKKNETYSIDLTASNYSGEVAFFAALGYRLMILDAEDNVVLDVALRSSKWAKNISVKATGSYRMVLAPVMASRAVFDIHVAQSTIG